MQAAMSGPAATTKSLERGVGEPTPRTASARNQVLCERTRQVAENTEIRFCEWLRGRQAAEKEGDSALTRQPIEKTGDTHRAGRRGFMPQTDGRVNRPLTSNPVAKLKILGTNLPSD